MGSCHNWVRDATERTGYVCDIRRLPPRLLSVPEQTFFVHSTCPGFSKL
uniref:Uncharacterized protein n=1 Tax=Anguilla anguilla TaxID=7936 RepID=A0A0E9UP48_ANGAN